MQENKIHFWEKMLNSNSCNCLKMGFFNKGFIAYQTGKIQTSLLDLQLEIWIYLLPEIE
ncbi:hypothetical protein [Algoriphagus boritolerans]|uniref:Uncharacterized protein n=1 Tax=Algoriphagus boritolerans DSM 17298 = JCM 18970 TaxID=1120964 RepID=A0A1H5RYX0_9BACT|nr:hypothetical protein [Algoriphagus boritolerans]SEF43556.1 hypothetical protein SAMN03080598_00195 [Algoriphagus boritolerans DSM 17298 = JCM 18970]